MLIDVRNLSFAYTGSAEPIFENLNLQLNSNWKLGFIGRNGYGKTTFFKLLQNELEYTGLIYSPIEFEYFPYRLKSINQNTQIAICETFPDIEIWQIERELSLLNLPDDILSRRFDTLSSGEQVKVLLATMFLIENKFMLIDEPTNHLDMNGRNIVAKYLSTKKGYIVASHDREFINQTSDHILAIEKNKIYTQSGNYDTWYKNKINNDNYEIEKNSQLKKDIKKLKDAARQKAGWSNLKEKEKIGAGDKGFVSHRAAKLMKRAKNIEHNMEKAISEKERLLKNIEVADTIPMKPLTYHSKTMLEATDFSIIYNQKNIFHPINFELHTSDVLCIDGKNGSGKSSILKLLAGENINFSGKFKIPKSIKVSYIPQTFDNCSGTLFEFIEKHNIDKSIFLATLNKFNFPQHLFEMNIDTYSSGQKKKILLAKSICESAHLYIWDEPLNYIDIISRIQIEQMIYKYKPTIILVEHDRKFTENYKKVSLDN